ncbi:MAG: hypothetical protein Q9227_004139 [Pyrenula ochraceoflavens]
MRQDVDERALKEQPVTWRSLPRKSQLTVLTLARLSEPLTQTSLSAYLFYQLKSFNPSLSDATISSQAGLLQASFTAAQFFTAVLWGRAADSAKVGRKRVLLIGLFGTCFSALGFGFSKSFIQAAIFRTLGGALNGNVGVLRTMIAEIVKEKKSVVPRNMLDQVWTLISNRYQSRAFLLLPMCFNIGVIIGPILGGILADPIRSFPKTFGPHSLLGGNAGVSWMQTWPYALPNIVSACFIITSAFGVILGLDETLESRKYKTDYGRVIGQALAKTILRRPRHDYVHLNTEDPSNTAIDLVTQTSDTETPTTAAFRRPQSQPKKLPFRQIWTANVLLTLLVHFLLAFHISAFNSLIFILLPAQRAPSSLQRSLLHFTGGLGLPSSKVGLATAIIGVIGFPLQILLYPRLHTRWGTLKCYRLFLPFSSIAYTLIPFLVLVPAKPWVVWPALVFVLGLQTLSRTFALPGAIILINNSSPSPTVLGTIHGVAQSVSSAGRTLGPMLCGWGLGLGMKGNTMGAVWWAMAGWAMLGWGLSFTVKEGNGGVEEDEKILK